MPKAFDRGTTDLLAKESSAPVSVPTANPGGDATSSGRNEVEARKDAARRAPIHTALEAAVTRPRWHPRLSPLSQPEARPAL